MTFASCISNRRLVGRTFLGECKDTIRMGIQATMAKRAASVHEHVQTADIHISTPQS